MSLTIVWFTLGLWTVASVVVQDKYPPINSAVTLTCDCLDSSCQKIYWYRIRQTDSVHEYLLLYNSADIQTESPDTLLKGRLQGRKGSSKSYTLTVSNLKLEDAGWYSCYVPSQATDLQQFSSYFLRVGETPPTQEPPRPKTTTKKKKRRPPPPACCSSYHPPEGCGKWILWPLSGTLVCLVVALAAVLYYFSRLPKKCRHHFAKKNQLA